MYIRELNSYIIELIKKQINDVLSLSKNGCDIYIKEHKNMRSNRQNSALWELYNKIVKFHEETGFFIDSIQFRFITSEFVHEYLKARFDLKTTTKLSTVEFMKYFDKINFEFVSQSNGQFEPMILEDKGYLERTGF